MRGVARNGLLLAFSLFAGIALGASPKWSAPAKGTAITGVVIGVSDGDTIRVLVPVGDEKRDYAIRFARIDAPEKAQAFGQRAKQFLSDTLYRQTVTVIVEDVDQYQRLVGQVVLNGGDINTYLVRNGYAWVYRQYNRDQAILEAEQLARNERRGLWSDTAAPQPPWEFRRSARDAVGSTRDLQR